MLLGIGIAATIFAWAFVGLAGLDLLPKDVTKHFDDPEERVSWGIRGVALLSILAGIAIAVFMEQGFWFDLFPEFVGLGLAVLGIDELNRRRSNLELKKQTFRQIRFSSNSFAIEALEVARHEGWLDEIICPETDLHGAHLEGANLEGAHLNGANLWEAHLEGAYLWGAHLEGANLYRAHLNGANLWEAHLEGAYLWGAHLEGAELRGAHLEGAELRVTNLNGADLGNAHLEGATLGGAQLEGAYLWFANLNGAYLYRAHLNGANLWEAHLEGANLEGAHLEGAELRGAHLEGAELREAHLEGANLSGTHLKEADLEGSHLEGALYSNYTGWPKDFDPESRGAINWDDLTKEEQEEWGRMKLAVPYVRPYEGAR